MADTLSLVSTICFVAAGVSLAVAAALFFAFKIPRVYGELSGRSARKSLEKLRSENESSAAKFYGNSGKVSRTEELTAHMSAEKGVGAEKTELLPEEGSESTTLLSEGESGEPSGMQTEGSESTTLLTEEGSESTTLLSDWDEGTELLDESKDFRIIDEVMLIHTDQTI